MLKYVQDLIRHPYLRKIMEYLEIAVFILCIVGVVVGAAIVLSTKLDIPGGYRLFTVETGSMEPKIHVGSAVLARIPKKLDEVKEGDIITFEQPGYNNKYITHRVYQKLKRSGIEVIATKGDVNAQPDPWLIAYGNIRGIYQRQIPYLGTIIGMIQTPLGVGLLIIVPALVIIIQELRNILKVLWEIKLGQFNSMRDEAEKPTTKPKKKGKRKLKKSTETIAVLIFVGFLLGLSVTDQSYALLSTFPTGIEGSSITTGTWDVAGDVVINEIMWMGSDGKSLDEWIELRNMTDHDISLDNWTIDGAGSGSDAVTLSGTIPAYGYFLLSHYDSTNNSDSNLADLVIVDNIIPGISLVNGGEILILKSNIGIVIDQTPAGAWAAGTNAALRQSMERNDDPTTGWHTCIAAGCNDTIFWDIEGNNYGTPKSTNLSDNDPSIQMAFPLILPDSQEDELTLPTPQPEPAIESFALGDNSTTISFTLINIGQYEKMNYIITYSSYNIIRGIGPSEVVLNGDDKYISTVFDLATCSSGICTYDADTKNFLLEITLTRADDSKLVLEKSIE